MLYAKRNRGITCSDKFMCAVSRVMRMEQGEMFPEWNFARRCFPSYKGFQSNVFSAELTQFQIPAHSHRKVGHPSKYGYLTLRCLFRAAKKALRVYCHFIRNFYTVALAILWNWTGVDWKHCIFYLSAEQQSNNSLLWTQKNHSDRSQNILEKSFSNLWKF